MDAWLRAGASEGRADVALVSSVVVLFGGRLAFGEEGPEHASSVFGGLGAPLFTALILSAALAAFAVRWSRPFAGAVRALVAAIAFFTLAVDPTLGLHGNGWYAVLGTVFAYTALVRVSRRRSAEDGSGVVGADRLAVAATSLMAGLLLAGVVFVVFVVLLIFWSLDGSN